MKNIFFISTICLLANFMTFGQTMPNTQINTFCEDGGFESGVINMNDFRYGYGNFYNSFLTSTFDGKLFLTPPPTPTSWNGSSPWNSSSSFEKWYEEITSPTNIPKEDFNTLLNVSTNDGNQFADRPHEQFHHKIESVGDDPVLGSVLQKVHSGNYSFRLGNSAVIRGAELMQKTFVVTPNTSQLSFWYAVVMGNPCLQGENCGPGITPHILGGIPSFMLKIKDDTDGTFHNNLVNLSNNQYYIDNTNPFLAETFTYTRNNVLSTHPESIKYMPWSFVTVDLSSLMNKQITVYFITYDCTASGHYAYAYLDDFCTEPGSDNPSGSIQLQDNIPTCGPGKICVDYILPKLPDGSTGDVNLSFNIYQNGNLVNTLTSGTLTSGSEYCFNINTSLLNSLNGTHFDYVVTGDFNLNGVSAPSQNIGTPGYGQNNIQNDDYQINCDVLDPQLCCDLPELQVDIRRPRFGSDQLSLVIGGITTPIQEIEVSVVDYHFTYSDPACQPANLGVFGNLSSNQNVLNGLNLSGSGTQVVNWKAGNPAVFNGQIPLKISKPNILKLTCCKGTFTVCLKVKVVDVNCNVCEKLVCLELPLEDQRVISNELPNNQIKN
ncbi:MAG: hypothetical protein KKC03_12605 [Bacteroidetes bacterium]|nr:hypothetical protein [Bacteroidota bacterium]